MTAPDGTTYTSANAASFPDVVYVKETGATWASFEVFGTSAGLWEVSVAGVENLGGYSVQVLKETARPDIQILEPAQNTSARR